MVPITASVSIMPSAYSVSAVRPGALRCSARTWVRTCIRVVFIQTKNGVSGLHLPVR